MRKYLTIAIAIALLVLATTSSSTYAAPGKTYVSGFIAGPPMVLLDQFKYNPNAAIGGVPFCYSGSLGSIMCYPPDFIKKAYNFPAGLDGTGQTIVIVDAFGSPTLQADLDIFDTTFHLPALTVTILCPPTWTGAASDVCPANQNPPQIDLGWAEETTLDVTMAHGLAPGAKIILVVAQDSQDASINAAEMAVVTQPNLKGSIMSQSFGEPDDLVGCIALDPNTGQCTQTDPTIKATADQIYQTATNNMWTILASTGDDGANGAYRYTGTTELTPGWPSTNTFNLAIGGTGGSPYGGKYGPPPGPGGTFSCAKGATCNTGLVVISGGTNGCLTALRPGEPSSCIPTSYGGEEGWNEWYIFGPSSSTGGGVSQLYQVPGWQGGLPAKFPTVLGSSVAASGRLTPDVSFNAAIYGGVLAYLGFLGRWAVFGGTSASSPAWAAIVALINQANGRPVGFVTPAIYVLARSSLYSKAFHDIVRGNNSMTAGQYAIDGFKASNGYDLTTGWGTPNVANLITGIVPYTSGKLAGMNLNGANLQGLNLQGANLQGANLNGANLQGVNLQGANLQGANLNKANLQGANLSGANLSGANLNGANMNNANLTNANFTNANCNKSTDAGATTTGVVTTGSNSCP